MTTLRSIDQVVAAVARAAHRDRRTLVGIAGAPGAGTSTIAAEVVDALGPTAVLLPMDGFHLPQATLVELGRRDRMGAPDTFDVPALLAILDALTVQNSGLPVRAPGFDRVTEETVPEAITVSPEFCTVVVEGNYLLFESGIWSRVAEHLDVSFYIEIDDDVRRERLIARHERFGKSPEDARAWTLGPDEANARIIGATASRADYAVSIG